ncbi:unnamed protein product [Pylaiella littoralis]
MRLILLLLLCCVAPGAIFVAKVAPSAPSESRLGRHDDGTRSSSSAFSGRRPSGRPSLFAHALRVRPDGGGRDDTPGESSTELRVADKKVDAIEEDIQAVGREIGFVGEKIEAVEAALSGGPPYLGITDRDLLLKDKEQLLKKEEQLRKEKEQLRKEKEQLRKEKEQFREEKLLLLKKQPAAAVSLAVDEVATNFAAALTRAVVTSNILELANGTLFIGHRKMGSKLFIRSCYKDLSKIIFDGAINSSMDNVVVTGTPGIGKSVFGYYLLYLLRLEHKTVVLEQKEKWYRFSDEGVVEGRFETFSDAGFLNDPAGWYLSDPEGKPRESFTGITVAVEQRELLSTDETGDALFHMLPSPGTAYECFDVVFASEYALELVEKAVSEREYLDFQGHVMASLEHADLNSKVGGSARGQMFERLAHATLTRSVRLKKPTAFNMTILSRRGRDVLGDGELSLNFTRISEFGGEAFPQTSLRGRTYYRPTSQTFPAVDSFFADRSTGTLYFCQMKSAGVEVIDTGARIEKYWKTASKSKSITKCVLVHVVPSINWPRAIDLGEGGDCLKGATADFKSECVVCAINLKSHLYG